MTYKAKKVVTLLVALLSVLCSFALGYGARTLTLNGDLKQVYDLLDKYKKYYYFDNGDILTDVENALLDKYSSYFTKEEYSAIKKQATGENVGIGVAVFSGTTTIAYTVGNSPCEKAGVKAGGNIVEVKENGAFKAVSNFNEFLAVINSTKIGDSIIFKVDYNGDIKEFSVVKEKYLTSYVTYCDSNSTYGFTDISGEMKATLKNSVPLFTNNDVGYIKYSSFSGTKSGLNGSVGQMKDALRIFKENGKTKLILDLRGNGGGYMDIFSDIASHFINVEDGKTALVSVAVDKNGNKQKFISKKSDYHSYGFQKIVVMCDEGTASAAEALIGAILDYDSENIVSVVVSSSTLNGETVYKTYGKGIMQTTYVNLDGSAVKLTTAGIFWPVSNVTIHDVGITTNVSSKVVNAQKETALKTALSLMN